MKNLIPKTRVSTTIKVKNAFRVIMKYIFMFYALISLSIFFIPEDILGESIVCLNFVNFMKNYFPNIEIIGNISPYTQLSKFYVSIMWIYIIIFSIFIVIYAFFYYHYLCWIDNKILSEIVKSNKVLIDCLFYIVCIILSGFGIYVYYTGYFASNGISIGAKHFMPEFQSRFEIFMYISFFSWGFGFLIFSILMSIYEIIYKIYFNLIRS